MAGEARLPADGAEDPRREGTWVIVPAFNEESRLGGVLDDLLRRWTNVVVVDDASTDATASTAAGRGAWLLRHAVNLGQGAALQTGIRFALSRGARTVVTFDADGQHSVDDVERLLAPLERGECAYALGSRFLGRTEGMPPLRRAVLKAAVLFTRLYSGVRLTDAHNGLRAMTREGAERLQLTMNRMEHATEILEQIRDSGLPFVEVPVTVRYSAESIAKGQRSSAAIRLGLRLLLEKVLK